MTQTTVRATRYFAQAQKAVTTPVTEVVQRAIEDPAVDKTLQIFTKLARMREF
jgi:hypothetical protein